MFKNLRPGSGRLITMAEQDDEVTRAKNGMAAPPTSDADKLGPDSDDDDEELQRSDKAEPAMPKVGAKPAAKPQPKAIVRLRRTKTKALEA